MRKFKNTEMLCQKYRTFLSQEVLCLAPLTPSVSTEKQSTIELHLEKSSTVKAEIIWKSVMSGYSACLNEDINETLATMFREFGATKLFQMS